MCIIISILNTRKSKPTFLCCSERAGGQTREKKVNTEAGEGPSTSTAESHDEGGGEKGDKKDEEEKDEVVEAVLTEEDLIQQSQAEYDSGRYSPTLLTSSELPLDTHTITPEEDSHRLQLARRQLQVTGMKPLQTLSYLKYSLTLPNN